jgi:hypothetical protein
VRVAVAGEGAHDIELSTRAEKRVSEDAGMLERMMLQDENARRGHGALSPRAPTTPQACTLVLDGRTSYA